MGTFTNALPDQRRLPSFVAGGGENSDRERLQRELAHIAARQPLSVTQARELAAAARRALAADIRPAEYKAAMRAEPTVGDVLDEYGAHILRLKRPASGEALRFHRAHLRPLDKVRVGALTHHHVVTLHHKIGETAGHTMANRCIDSLRGALNHAKKHDRINFPSSGNQAEGIERYPEPARERFLLPAELVRLREALAAAPQDIHDLVELALYTGARKSALLTAAWSEFNLAQALWTVPAAHSKNGKPYTIPLLPQALAILQRRLAAYPSLPRLFFLSESGAERGWQAVRDAAKLPDVRFHDLRRTHGAALASSGASLHLVGQALGHSSTRATAVYARCTLTRCATLWSAPGSGSPRQSPPKSYPSQK